MKVRDARDSGKSGHGAEQVDTLGVRDLRKGASPDTERGKELEGRPRSPTVHSLFVGEVKKGKVTGFHNWIRFYMQEKEGLVDYYSYIYDGPVSTEC